MRAAEKAIDAQYEEYTAQKKKKEKRLRKNHPIRGWKKNISTVQVSEDHRKKEKNITGVIHLEKGRRIFNTDICGMTVMAQRNLWHFAEMDG